MTDKYKIFRLMSKRSKNYMLRFRTAYERLNYSQRQVAQQKFCEVHRISHGTFRNKMNGINTLFETEVTWMEGYDPHSHQPVAASL